MKKLITLLVVLAITACTPTKPDGTPYACAAEAMGIGSCYGSIQEGVYITEKLRLEGEIQALKLRIRHNH